MTREEYLAIEIDRLDAKIRKVHSWMDPKWSYWRDVWTVEQDFLIEQHDQEIESREHKMRNGFTLVEILVAVAIIAILVMAVSFALSTIRETKVVACLADIESMNAMSEQLYEQCRPDPPTIEEMEDFVGAKNNGHYFYTPNNSDANNGHGNDIDFCDEENPGESTENRDCLDIDWIWVCDHDHGDLVKFNFAVDGPLTYAMLIDGTKPPFLKDIREWDGPEFSRDGFMGEQR